MTRKQKKRLSNALVVAFLAVCSVFMVGPFIWMLSTSLKTLEEAFRFPPTFIPESIQWQNYADIFEAAPFGRFYFNSIVVAVAVTVGQLTTCSMGAYAFARLRFKGRDKMFLMYLATLMVPFQVTMIPIFIIVKNLGWIDTYQALIVPTIFSPYGTFLLRQFFMTIPNELEESVKIDGGGYFRCFFQIILPLTKPALATLGTFVFLFSWNNFQWPLLVINTLNMNTLPLGISFFQGRFATQWNLLMAAATITMLPLLIVYLFAQRYFIEGITLSGMKG